MISAFANEALEKLLSSYKFDTVLDVGCGKVALHAKYMQNYGKKVTGIDFYPPEGAIFRAIKGNYMQLVHEDTYDCLWVSHVLEHQLDVQAFLRKVHSNLVEGGVLAVTVPPRKDNIVGGHLSMWNMGLLLYRLILAGFDCSEAIGKKYGYNVSVIVKKRSIDIDWSSLAFDTGDIERLYKYFPNGRVWRQEFNGDIDLLNW